MLWKKHKQTRPRISPQPDRAASLVVLAKIFGIFMLLSLMIGNIVVFAKSVHLADSISTLEKDITTLRKENEYLQKKMYAENSLVSLQYTAEQLGFTKQAEPVFFEKPHYAMAQ